jgi:hypothetical protein
MFLNCVWGQTCRVQAVVAAAWLPTPGLPQTTSVLQDNNMVPHCLSGLLLAEFEALLRQHGQCRSLQEAVMSQPAQITPGPLCDS